MPVVGLLPALFVTRCAVCFHWLFAVPFPLSNCLCRSRSCCPDLGVGSLLGVGMFLTTFVLGCVAVIEEFVTFRRPFFRDM